ncbi:MAG: pyridoxal phosphate-dependent aminotransferase [Thaumarchaeota archaeon]|nr:pyridoxal phosphate-dependent aminotransferase [Nitrososphaerota archaeon]
MKTSPRRGPASSKIRFFMESAIREMSALADATGAVNLAVGSPDFPAPPALKRAAIAAIRGDNNQYEVNAGSIKLRRAIAEKVGRYNRIEANAEDNVTVTCGSTEAITAAMVALTEAGDKVIIPEPFYESYVPATIISGAKAIHVRLEEPGFAFREEDLKAAFSQRPRVILVNTPNNPTGRVFSASELRTIADLCEDYDVIAITDEIYERIIYDGKTHVSLAAIGNMHERTVTVSGMSKTYSITGWRVGYAVAEKRLTKSIRTIHDFLTVCAPSPFQEAALRALQLPESYYRRLTQIYEKKRRYMTRSLSELGFNFQPPEGAYYIFADFEQIRKVDDYAFAEWLVKEVGVAVVPASSFYADRSGGRSMVRVAFPKKEATLREAVDRMKKKL